MICARCGAWNPPAGAHTACVGCGAAIKRKVGDTGGGGGGKSKRRKRTLATAPGPVPMSGGTGSAPPPMAIDPLAVVAVCVAPQPVATPHVDLDYPVVLFDKNHRATHPAAPTPTATPLRLRCDVVGGAYAGGGSLTLGTGNARLYRDAACTVLAADFGIPGTTLLLTNAELVAGIVFYALGHARGGLGWQLVLDAQGGVDVRGPATSIGTVVELTASAHEFGDGRVLGPDLALDRGKLLGVPLATAKTLRARIDLAASAGGGPLVTHVDPAHVGRVAGYSDAWGNQAVALNAPMAPPRPSVYLTGLAHDVARIWVGLGMEMPDGTVLEHGDSILVRPVQQQPTSVGYEWEINSLMLERRHDAGVLRDEAAWEGLPSKATAYEDAAVDLRLDSEVSHNDETYGEIVLGPVYDHAHLEAQFAAIQHFVRLTSYHEVVVVACPRDIATRPPLAPGRWMPAGHSVVCHKRRGPWSGTAQASFGAPIWMLPTFLANLAGPPGGAAKTAAETAAAANPHVDEHVMGLIAACQYYIEVMRGRAVINDDDGPKTALPVMFRTDFHAMHGLLAGAQVGAFAAWAGAHPHRGQQLLPNGYSRGGGIIEPQGPQIGAWLDTVIAGVGGGDTKDSISPPPGFPRHHTNPTIPYGMGALGLDGATQHVIAEYRPFSAGMTGVNAFIGKAYEWAQWILLDGAATWTKVFGRNYGPPGAALPGRLSGKRHYTPFP